MFELSQIKVVFSFLSFPPIVFLFIFYYICNFLMHSNESKCPLYSTPNSDL